MIAHRALHGVFCVVLLTAVTWIAPAQWRWPVEDLSSFRIVDAEDGFSVVWRAQPSEERAVAPVAEGALVYDDRPTGPQGGAVNRVPSSEPRVVARHDGEIWSVYRADRLTLPPDVLGPGAPLPADSRMTAQGNLELTLVDAVHMKEVNPRALLPSAPSLPLDELPVVSFRQDGNPTLGRDLKAGTASLVAPAQWLDVTRLPRRIYILVDGLLAADIGFSTPDQLRRRLAPEGYLRLVTTDLQPGPVLYEVEAHRFDGGVERRVIRLRIPEPPALDTN